MSGTQNAFPGSQNALQNGGVQKPMFAPVSQGTQLGEDLDLNDIFADYFISEFEDPLNAYTSSMANYTGAAAAVALAQQQQSAAAALPQAQLSAAPATIPQAGASGLAAVTHAPAATGTASLPLPTGRGIKTAWHSGALPNVGANGIVVQQTQTQQPLSKKHKGNGQLQTEISVPTPVLPTGGIQHQLSAGGIQHQLPTGGIQHQKLSQQVDASPSLSANVAPPAQPAASPAPAGTATSSTAGGLSGRLGFSLVGGHLAVPQRGSPTAQQQQAMPSEKAAAPGNVSLPVGVGIRLGGVGGAASQTGQPAGGGVPLSQWNSAGTGNLAHIQHGQSGVPSPFMTWSGLSGVAGAAGGMSEQAIAERRQRNREHAKRSRVRKKFLLESLQEEVRGLQKENVQLRMLVQEKIPQHAQEIIDKCCKKSSLFADSADSEAAGADSGAKETKETALVKSDFNLITSLTSGQQNFVLSDPRLPDNPIVYASEGFYELTGYTREQVLGRNCRFLQGPGTDPKAVDVIRAAIANGNDATTCLLNYKADGTPFWNQFFVAALRDSDNCIVNYVGVQCAVEPEAGASALEDKVNSVLPLQHKGEDTPAETK